MNQLQESNNTSNLSISFNKEPMIKQLINAIDKYLIKLDKPLDFLYKIGEILGKNQVFYAEICRLTQTYYPLITGDEYKTTNTQNAPMIATITANILLLQHLKNSDSNDLTLNNLSDKILQEFSFFLCSNQYLLGHELSPLLDKMITQNIGPRALVLVSQLLTNNQTQPQFIKNLWYFCATIIQDSQNKLKIDHIIMASKIIQQLISIKLEYPPEYLQQNINCSIDKCFKTVNWLLLKSNQSFNEETIKFLTKLYWELIDGGFRVFISTNSASVIAKYHTYFTSEQLNQFYLINCIGTQYTQSLLAQFKERISYNTYLKAFNKVRNATLISSDYKKTLQEHITRLILTIHKIDLTKPWQTELFDKDQLDT